MNAITGRIEGGIEFYPTPHGEESCCARCGSSAEFVPCANCGGELYVDHECGEDSCCCLDPEPNVLCDWCRGAGGSWHCISPPNWCQAHPLPGREHVPSTALKADGWRDVA